MKKNCLKKAEKAQEKATRGLNMAQSTVTVLDNYRTCSYDESCGEEIPKKFTLEG